MVAQIDQFHVDVIARLGLFQDPLGRDVGANRVGRAEPMMTAMRGFDVMVTSRMLVSDSNQIRELPMAPQGGTLPTLDNRKDTKQCEHISRMLARISDKWTLLVVRMLGRGPCRFNALRREVGEISQKVLASTLRDLEENGFVSRTVYAPATTAAGRIRPDRPGPRVPVPG